MAERTEIPTEDWGESEAEQLRRAKARDPLVWASWHDAYYPLLYRYVLARLGSKEDAEDTTSQVFLEAIKSIDRCVHHGQPIIAWFYGIAHHLVSRRRREMARAGGSLEEALSDSIEMPDEEAATVDRLVIAAVLEQLKDEHREVLTLRYMLGMPSKQVARVLGKSESATYSLQVRALTAVRRVGLSQDARRTGRTRRAA